MQKKVLILSPKTTILSWRNEFEKEWLPHGKHNRRINVQESVISGKPAGTATQPLKEVENMYICCIL